MSEANLFQGLTLVSTRVLSQVEHAEQFQNAR